jgi:hypothetical protein
MSTPTLNAVRLKLAELLGEISPAAGYATSLDPEKVLIRYSPRAHARGGPEEFPKVFILFDGGENHPQPGMANHQTVTLIVLAAFRDRAEGTDAQAQASDFLDDLDAFLMQNSTLSGTVESAVLGTFALDSGETAPEAVLAARVDIMRVKYYG